MDRFPGLVIALLLLLAGLAPAAGAAGAIRPITPYLAHRQAGVVIQTDWTTCGPAAVATLLAHFFGIPATEGEVIRLARPHMPEGQHPEVTGYTLGSLREALRSLGYISEGYRMDLEALMAYQDRVQLPVLVHLVFPQPHFAVLIGSGDGHFVLADPSWGMVVEPEATFTASWSGYVLVTLPDREQLSHARKTAAALLQTYLEVRPRQLLRVTGSAP